MSYSYAHPHTVPQPIYVFNVHICPLGKRFWTRHCLSLCLVVCGELLVFKTVDRELIEGKCVIMLYVKALKQNGYCAFVKEISRAV